jgi:hypothetical protein
MATLSELLTELRVDPWREATGFSVEMNAAHDILFGAYPAEKRQRTLNEWIERWQPCLFGKIAAKLGAIRFCVVDQLTIDASDEKVSEAIQDARLQWRRDAARGKASAFVIVVAVPALAISVPDDTVRQIAIRVASLYLKQAIEVDQVYQERIFLETPGSSSGWIWRGGVDYFAAHADHRWWHDHRFPGGIAFSVNSLGHLVRCAQMANALDEFDSTLGLSRDDEPNRPRLETNARALEFALRTIKNSSNAISGKSTMLLPSNGPRHPRCPVLSADFASTDATQYKAYYDTDFTLRSEFFRADVNRPSDVGLHTMDFTYLYDDHFENYDHAEMMRGIQVKGADEREPTKRRPHKHRTVMPEPISADADDEFRRILG